MRHTQFPIPSYTDFYQALGLAEIYLVDGAPITELQLIREAMEIANPSLSDDEDWGDVSDHLKFPCKAVSL